MKIDLNKEYKIEEEHFYEAVGGKQITERTIVSIKVSKQYLIIKFNCLDNPFINENLYHEDNSELFKQEVFEIFISTGKEAPTDYLEVEINPNNAIFTAFIRNNDKIGSKLQAQKIDRKSSGIISNVTKQTDSWSGEIKIPMKLINGDKNTISKDYRFNIFRIISKQTHNQEEWTGNPDDCIYACWKYTNSPLVPRFHRTEYFSELYIDF